MFLNIGDGLGNGKRLAGIAGPDIEFFGVVFEKSRLGAGLANDFDNSFVFDGFEADLKITKRIHS